MKKPRILVAAYADNAKNEPYIQAVEEAGGEAICLYAPPVDLSYDGLLLCGGEDVAPSHYGEESHGAELSDQVRDEAELALARAYIAYGKPIFGICRGAQVLNVALGGTLWQSLHTVAQHRAPVGILSHTVRAQENSLLWDLYDSDFTVNSRHHQALRLPGCGVVPTAWARDGVIEGFEHERLPLFGVQWHPECSLQGEDGCVPGLPLFRYFLCLCREQGSDLHALVQRDPDVRFACGMIED